jgi:hypothetical protein
MEFHPVNLTVTMNEAEKAEPGAQGGVVKCSPTLARKAVSKNEEEVVDWRALFR